MAYFDGGIHGMNTVAGYIPAKPNTRILCDDCAEPVLPLKPKGTIGRHWGTGFRWAPRYGAPCGRCLERC
jgi:hypothetical protein